MNLESIPFTRSLARLILKLTDMVSVEPFPRLKRVRQITNSHCGPAVLVALFSNLGIRVSQKSIVKSLRARNKIKDFGLTIKEMAKAARISGEGETVFWKKINSRVSDLDQIVNKYKYPVGVEWQGVFYENDDGDSGHYGIITRVNKQAGFLRLSDPYRLFAGVDRKFRIKDFLDRWWDENEIRITGTSRRRKIFDYRLIFVITPRGETWPKKLGMKRA